MSSDGIATAEVASNAEGLLKSIISSLRATLTEIINTLHKLTECAKLNTESETEHMRLLGILVSHMQLLDELLMVLGRAPRAASAQRIICATNGAIAAVLSLVSNLRVSTEAQRDE